MLDVYGDYYGHDTSADDSDIQPLDLEQKARAQQIRRSEPAARAESLNDTVAFMRSKLAALPVLSAEQERELTLQLSRSTVRLALLCLSTRTGATMLSIFIQAAKHQALKKHMFSEQSLYFALRRELDDLVSGDNNKVQLAVITKELASNKRRDDTLSASLFDAVLAVEWPGPLVLACANRLYTQRELSSKLDTALNEYLVGKLDQAFYLDNSESMLVKQYTREYLRYRDMLVNHNLRLVFRIAKRFSDKHEYFADLLQEGVFGLIRAAEKYRPSTGYRFSTYAHQWIESKVKQARVNIDKLLPVSRKYNNELIHISQCIEKYKHSDKRLTDKVLADETGIKEERLKMLMAIRQYVVSLDDRDPSDEGLSLHAKIPAPESDLYIKVASNDYAEFIDRVIDEALSDRERFIINSRFGRHNREAKTLKELSEVMHLSRERIRQLEIAALKKLGEHLRASAQR